jgi:serine acetyltransferase
MKGINVTHRQNWLSYRMIRISKDIDIAHQRRWPGRPMSRASRLWLLAISPGLQLLLFYRIDHWLYLKRQQNDGGIRKWLWRTLLISLALVKMAIKINSKSEIGNFCEIEDGIFFSDQGYIIFGARKIGAGTVIGTQVTAGKSHVDDGLPEIGRDVWIGSDCVIYGAISIGDGATLLPSTVLTKSIPPGVVMQGNPARVVLRNFDNSELRKRHDVDAIQYVNTKRGG